MFADFDVYRGRKEFRSGFSDVYQRYGGMADGFYKKESLLPLVDNLILQFQSKIKPLIELNPSTNGSQLFFLTRRLGNQDFESFLRQGYESSSGVIACRYFLIDVILDLMFETCSSFGLLEIQQLFGYVVSTQMVMDVVGSLKILDYINNLYLAESLSVDDQQRLSVIQNSIMIADERIEGVDLNAKVFGFIGERFFSYQVGTKPATVENFVEYLSMT